MEVPADKFIDIVEFYDSLTRAITDAGGAHPNIKHLMNMTVKELGERLAPNGIRFVCTLAKERKIDAAIREAVAAPVQISEAEALALMGPLLLLAVEEQLRGRK